MEQMEIARLENCMRRAGQGEELTIGFFGGSITQDCAATVHENSYAYRVFDWWKRTFPNAGFHYVNGGIGGTTSHFGAARVVEDLLMYQPDLVVIDFSVNDEANAFFQETFEGLLRRILSWKSQPAVLILNNVFYDTGENAQEYHNAIAGYYHVPHVSIKDTLYQNMLSGVYTREELTQDGLHPNDRGHELVAEEIIAFLEKVHEGMSRTGALEVLQEKTQPGEAALKKPVTVNAYEHIRRLTIREASPKLSGFRADSAEKKGHLDFFKNGWIGKRAGDYLAFEVTASCIAVQYRRTITRPALRAKLTLDGDAENARILDGNFDKDWGDCLYLEPVLHHGERCSHFVEIEILEDKAEDATPFYFLSLLIG